MTKLDSSIRERLIRYEAKLQELLNAPCWPFDVGSKSDVPEYGGVYVISHAKTMDVLYVGTGASIRVRVYTNHWKGSGKSTLRRKLLKRRECSSREQVTEYLSHYVARWIDVPDERERCFFEHFVIAALQPPWND